MTPNVALHRPVRAEAFEFTSDGIRQASLDIIDEQGHRVTIFTTPAMASAMANAFNTTKQIEEAAAGWANYESDLAAAQAEHRAREMNAELPAAERSIMLAKGLIS